MFKTIDNNANIPFDKIQPSVAGAKKVINSAIINITIPIGEASISFMFINFYLLSFLIIT